jgi:hypothetical protein
VQFTDILVSILSLVGPLSLVICLIVLGLLSQRLGAVTRRTPLYRLLFVSSGLVGLSLLVRLPTLGQTLDAETALAYDIPLTLGLLLAVIIVWRYWGWLLGERGKNTH